MYRYLVYAVVQQMWTSHYRLLHVLSFLPLPSDIPWMLQQLLPRPHWVVHRNPEAPSSLTWSRCWLWFFPSLAFVVHPPFPWGGSGPGQWCLQQGRQLQQFVENSSGFPFQCDHSLTEEVLLNTVVSCLLSSGNLLWMPSLYSYKSRLIMYSLPCWLLILCKIKLVQLKPHGEFMLTIKQTVQLLKKNKCM